MNNAVLYAIAPVCLGGRTMPFLIEFFILGLGILLLIKFYTHAKNID